MKVRFSLCICFILLAQFSFSQEESLQSVLLRLDKALQESKQFCDSRESRISALKTRLLANAYGMYESYRLNMDIYKEYRAYKCDSAIVYLNHNIQIAEQLDDTELIYESKLLLSALLSGSGMYKEAVDIIETINRSKLPPTLTASYYSAYESIFGELSRYTQNRLIGEQYRQMAHAYRDSLFNILPRDNSQSLLIQENMLRDSGKIKEALAINDIRLSKAHFGTPEYAIITFFRSLAYFDEQDRDKEKYYLALSALSDIYSATKDHASLWMLAQRLFNEGDIDRAYTYIRFSWDETVFYNARLRSLQSAGILSLIDKTYQMRIEKQNDKLEQSLMMISILAILLLIALFYIYSQIKRLGVAKNNLQTANNQLLLLNEELQHMNTRLSSSNTELSESNRIKEEYIGRFIKLCSTYIDKLDTYRRMVNKNIMAGRTNEILRLTGSQDALNNELNELFKNFDTTFLQLFPDFIKEFNQLLLEDEAILPKKDELLNTELRIFALIRLGITDSSQIADFLRYSVNTIYNYRAKVKNKARGSRDDFEEMVMKIR